MNGDLERKVRAALDPWTPSTADEGSELLVATVVRLIEEERAGLVERLNREAENHAACDDQTRGIIAGLRERAEKAEAERDRFEGLLRFTEREYSRDVTEATNAAIKAEAAVARVRALCEDEDPEMTFPEWQQAILAALDGPTFPDNRPGEDPS
jgi:hypothetical protein